MDSTQTQLQRWDPMRGEIYAEMIGHPRFPRAARALVRGAMFFREGEFGLDNLFRDAGSYVAAMWVVYLHASGDLTLPALKEIGAASGYLSTGRARDLLNLMQHLKFIEMLSPAAGAAPARYGPTPEFLTRWYTHHREALASTVEVEPAVQTVLAHMHDAQFAKSFARAHAHNLFVVSAGSGGDNPFYRTFMHRRAGSHVVGYLALSGEDDAPFPDEAPIAVAPTSLARRFGVSRIHLKRMLDDAVAQGFLAPHGRDAMIITEGARPIFRFHYAFQLIQLLAAAKEAWGEHAARLAPAPAEVRHDVSGE